MEINCASCNHVHTFWVTPNTPPLECLCDLTNARHPGDYVCDQWLGKDAYGRLLRKEFRDEPNAAD